MLLKFTYLQSFAAQNLSHLHWLYQQHNLILHTTHMYLQAALREVSPSAEESQSGQTVQHLSPFPSLPLASSSCNTQTHTSA